MGNAVGIGNYHVVNLMLGYSLSDHLDLMLSGRNLFNEFGVTNATDTGGASSPVVTVIPPRSIEATLQMRFGD